MTYIPRTGWLAALAGLALACPMPTYASGCGCAPTVSAAPVRTYRLEHQTVYDEFERTGYRYQWETQVVERPVTVYRQVMETEMRERSYTVRRPVYETNEREESFVVRRPVVETVMQDRSYNRVRTVCETSEREETYTVRRPVWETVEREVQHTVCRPVVETQMREQAVTVMQPVTTCRQQVVQTGTQVVCQPVVEPRCCLSGLFGGSTTAARPYTYDTAGYGLDPSGQFMTARPVVGGGLFAPRSQVVMRPVLQPVYSTVQVPLTTMRPVTEIRQTPVQVVRYEQQIEVRRVPEQVCRWVEEQHVRRVPVTTQRQVVERVEQQVPVRVCRWVEETQTRRVPFTTVRYVEETKTEQIPVRVCRQVAEERVVREARQVCNRVPYNYTVRVPRVETRYIELDPCSGMPVAPAMPAAPLSPAVPVPAVPTPAVGLDPADRQPALPQGGASESRREDPTPMSDSPGAEETTIRSTAPAEGEPSLAPEVRVPVEDPEADVDVDLDAESPIEEQPEPAGVEIDLNAGMARTAAFRSEIEPISSRRNVKTPPQKLHENDFGPLVPLVRPGSGRTLEQNMSKPDPVAPEAPAVEPEGRTVSTESPTRPYHVILVSRPNR